MAKKYIKNTVKGHRRGSKYPDEVKTAALCAMLTSNNLADVARRLHDVAGKYSVPESTLRRWYNDALKDTDGQKSVFAKAREDAIRRITLKAAQGAALTVDLAVRRIEKSNENDALHEELNKRLLELDTSADNKEILRLEREKQIKSSMSDFAVTNYMRSLAAVGEHTLAEQDKAGGGAKVYEDYLAEISGEEW